MNLQPLGDRVLVEPNPGLDQIGSIIIPDSAKKGSSQLNGKVISVGEGRMLPDGTIVPMTVKPGDHVFWAKFTGNEIKIEGNEYLILAEKDLIAVITPDAK